MSSATSTMSKKASKMCYLQFEVFGKVQGVFFRKHTEEQAKALALKGWCKNTKENTVKGEAIGETPNIDKFVHWLTNTGSPKSIIEKCESSISDATEEHIKKFKSFRVIKD